MKENELEFSDWPMFDLLMTNEELCRELLEVVLDAPVSNIEYIIAENDIRPTLTNHGVRLDAYVKTENEVCNIEMQTVKRAKLGRRLRFYQGAMDTLALRRGEHYGNLPPCYIVFICLHDPFNAGLPVYTLNVKCQENTSVKTDHGFTWIVLAAPAWDRLPPGRLRNLLHYIATGEAGDDRFATKLAAAVRAANGDEAWRKEKMALLTFEEDMEIHCDLRQFAGYTITEHLVLTNDDLKAVNTEAQPDTVAPAKGNTVSLKDGELSGYLTKHSWNMIRMKKM